MVCLTNSAAHAQSSATLSIQASQPGTLVSSNLFGIFFEEINDGGDDGLTLFWPVASAGYVVIVATNLAGGVWSVAAAVTPQIVGGQWPVALPVSGEPAILSVAEMTR